MKINWKLWWHLLWRPAELTKRLAITEEDLAKATIYDRVVLQRNAARWQRDRMRELLSWIRDGKLEDADWQKVREVLAECDEEG
ncbi:MAG: hypothetical protein ABFE07_28435 [Armatimonadia bacterium]